MRMLVVLLLLLVQTVAWADNLLMVRSRQPFAETMLALQGAIRNQGYTVSRVQRVDIGLTRSGFETDKYRVVFFAKPDELRRLTAEYAEIIPYVPLKIALFAEGEETIAVAADPELLIDMYEQPALHKVFARWSTDMRAIFEQVRLAE